MIEGRDIGTVVAPGRRGEGLPRRRPGRARRAGAQAERPEIGADALATDLELRDESRPRADAARRRTPSEIDTTDLEVDDVVARIEELVRARALAA